MNSNATEVDPLSSQSQYSLNNFHNFESYDNLQYPYTVNVEQCQNAYNYYNKPQSNMKNSQENRNSENSEIKKNDVKTTDNKDIAIPNIGKQKIKKERSKYFSEKITEKDFPFYGCALCNLSYQTLHELDTHVLIHKERVTSYDLRIKNQMKKRKLKKEMKKNKKLKKAIKTEIDLEIEIKPEDGYIGNEKATEFINNGESDNQSLKENKIDTKTDKKKVTDNTKAKDKGKDEELQKIYKCFACQKQFTLSYYLKLHVRSHTGM